MFLLQHKLPQSCGEHTDCTAHAHNINTQNTHTAVRQTVPQTNTSAKYVHNFDYSSLSLPWFTDTYKCFNKTH